MRFEYDPPEPLLLVAADGQFFISTGHCAQPTTLPLGRTPLGMLLRDELRLSGDVTVSRRRARRRLAARDAVPHRANRPRAG